VRLEILKTSRVENVMHMGTKRVNLCHLILHTVRVFFDLSRDLFLLELSELYLKLIKLLLESLQTLGWQFSDDWC